MKTYEMLIGGEWRGARSGRLFDVYDPALDEVIARVPDAGAEDVGDAVAAARRAFRHGWRDTTAQERGRVLFRLAEVVRREAPALAELETRNCGKPIVEAELDIADVATCLEYYGGLATKVHGEVVPVPDQALSLALREPIGVAGQIIPWNYPLLMAAWKIAPAIAAGCTMVIKPASATPFSALAMAELAERAGVPKGVISVVTGSASAVGGEMTSNPIVRKLTFTGSTEIGKVLMEQCARTVKKTSMELGGNAPFIVFDDADLDAAADGAIASKYRNAGQTCVCANRILVQDKVYDAFAAKLGERVAKLKVGNGMEAGVTTGPLIDAAAVAKVEEHIADAVAKGARIVTGGKRHALGGLFFEPTILANVDTTMKVTKEETFGPVAPLFRFKDEAEAIRMANDTEFGLASYFYARDIGRIWRVSEGLEYGIVGINSGIISTEVAPFGGVKESGLGREGSKYGIEDYLEIKYLCMTI